MDTWINPATRDYACDKARVGALQRDPAAGLANAAYLRLMTPRGSWFADSTVGSRLHELQREKDLPRVERLARQYAQQALAPLLDDGRAAEIEIETTRSQDGTGGSRLALAVAVTDARGVRTTFEVPVKVI